MSDGFSTNWTPPPVPGSDPNPVPQQSSDSSAGWDWSWLTDWTTFGDPNLRPGPPGGGRLGPPQTDQTDQLSRFFSGLFSGGTDEQKLADLIIQKMGAGDPRDPAQLQQRMEALRAAHAAMLDPNYRQQLAVALGWNLNNPHVQYWLKNGTNLPSDPTGTGAGGTTSGGAPGAGAAPGGAAAGTGALAAPFDPSKYGGRGNDPGFTYGALLPPNIAAAAGVDRQWGVDYALPMGTALNAPFAGTVIAAGWNGPYGETVMIRLPNGVTYRVAHLSAINVQVGQSVSTGALLGAVGSTGNSTGPHVLIEMKDSAGNPIDPTPIIDQLIQPGADLSVNGAAYRKYQDLSAMVTGTPAYAGQVMPYRTPDGHWIYPGSNDDAVYTAATNLWKKRYGGNAPWSFVSAQIAAGNTTAEQIQAAMDAMSSDITGMSWGQRDQFSSDANAASDKAWSRPVPDATLKQLAGLGITTAGQIQAWINSHPASAIDPQTYAQIYDTANQQTQPLWQQPPSPDLVAHIHQQMQAGPQGA